MRAAISFREIEKRHHVNKTMAFRHRRHMDATPAAGVETDADKTELDLKAILRTAQKALVRASRKNDLKAIDTAYSLLQKLQHANGGAPVMQDSSSRGIASCSDGELERRSIEYLKVIYADRIEDWRNVARTVENALQAAYTLTLPITVPEEPTLPDSNGNGAAGRIAEADGEGSKNLSRTEPASDCSDTGEVEVLQGSGTIRFPNPEAIPKAPPEPAKPAGIGAHYQR